MNSRKKFAIILVGLILLVSAVAAWYFSTYPANRPLGVVGSTHEHANFMVFVDGSALNFSQEKYMSNDSVRLSRFIHLHDLDGGVIHKHATGVTLGLFFESIGMQFNSTCLTLDDGMTYCNSGGKSLKMVVNGRPNSQFEWFEVSDLDRILISFGSQSQAELEAQFALVPDNACIPSGKCPERGLPGNESGCGLDDNCIE